MFNFENVKSYLGNGKELRLWEYWIGLQIQFSILETSNQMEFNLSYPWQTVLTQKIVDTSKCELVKESHRCWVIGSKGCAMQVRIFAFSQIFIILKTIKNVKNHP